VETTTATTEHQMLASDGDPSPLGGTIVIGEGPSS